MATTFPKLDSSVGTQIGVLGDNPNTDDNLTAAQLKAKFDYDGAKIKEYLNGVTGGAAGLVDELNEFAEDIEDALADKLEVGSLPEDIGIKMGTTEPTTDDISEGQIYLMYEA